MRGSIDREKWEVLRQRDFFLLTFGRVGSALGSKVFGISIMWWMLETRGPGSAGIVTALTLTGAIILRPLGGVLVDRIDRRRSLVSADSFGALFVGILAVAAALGTLQFWHFVVAIVGTSLTSAIVSPATRSLIPKILDEEDLTAGNSALSSLTNVSSLAGPAVAGALLAVFSYELVFLLNAASYGFAAIAEFLIRTTSSESVTESDDDRFLTDLREGFEYVWESKRIRRIAITAVAINAFATPLLLVGPTLIERNGYSAFYAGLTETLFAVGTLVAGLALLTIEDSDSPDVWETEVFGGLAFAGFIAFIAAIAVVAAPEALLPILLGTVFLISLGGGVADIKNDAVVQATADEEKMGRVFGTMRTFGNAAMPLSLTATGFLLEAVDAAEIFFVLAAGISLTVVVFGRRQVYALLTGSAITADGSIVERESAE
jgi:DHA3 family macrolide efflux protein-like MFS transporter